MKNSTLLLLLAFASCASLALATDNCTATHPCNHVKYTDIVDLNCFYWNRTFISLMELMGNDQGNHQYKDINMLSYHGFEHWAPTIRDSICLLSTLTTTDVNYNHPTPLAQKITNETYVDVWNKNGTLSQHEILEILAFIYGVGKALQGSPYDPYDDGVTTAADIIDCICKGYDDTKPGRPLSPHGFRGYGLDTLWGWDTIFSDGNAIGHINPFLGDGYSKNLTLFPPVDSTSTIGDRAVDDYTARWKFGENFAMCMYVFKDQVVQSLEAETSNTTDIAACIDNYANFDWGSLPSRA